MLNDNNYLEFLKEYTVFLINNDSCANCYNIVNELHTLTKELKLNYYIITADNNIKNLLVKFEIVKTPTILLFYEKELIGKITGYQPNEILKIWFETKIDEKRRGR